MISGPSSTHNEEEEIRRLWEGEMNDITIVDISKEILDKIFKKRMNDGGFIPPQKLTQKYEEEQNKLFEEDNINVELIPKRPEKINGKNFIIRDHQSEAALNWEKNNFRVITN